MANTAQTSEVQNGAGRGEVVVDPAIAAVIQSAGAPRGVPRMVNAPTSLPGIAGTWWAMHGLVGTLRHGVAYAVQKGLERFGDVYRAPFIGASVVMVWDADEIHRMLKNEGQVWSTAMGWDAIMFEGLDSRSGN